MEALSRKIIELASDALAAEDLYLRESVSSNPCYSGKNGGLLLINNERFYQFAIARYLIKHLRRPVLVESQYHDLMVLREDGAPEIVVEMKRWMTAQGNVELRGIKEDIEKLERLEAPIGLLMIFS